MLYVAYYCHKLKSYNYYIYIYVYNYPYKCHAAFIYDQEISLTMSLYLIMSGICYIMPILYMNIVIA